MRSGKMFAAALLGCVSNAPAGDPAVLVFTKTAGYRHESIPAAVETVQQLGKDNCFTVTHTENASDFNAANLASYRVVMFLNTTGNVLDEAQQAAFEGFIRAGNSFVGVHSATDTEHNWPFYGELIGAYFANHPVIQGAELVVEDAADMSTFFLPSPWARTDEWYNFQTNPRPRVHVLLTLDESTYSGGTMGDHPIAWRRTYEGGRSFYTASGHRTETYAEPLFRRHLLGGILWALGADALVDCNNNGSPDSCDIALGRSADSDADGIPDECSCRADFDADGFITGKDYDLFVGAFEAGDSSADFDCDGFIAGVDFDLFVQAFELGC